MRKQWFVAAALVTAFALGTSVFFPASVVLAEDKPTISPTPAAAAKDAESYKFPALGQAPIVNLDELRKILSAHGSELLVVNFWATSCAPCVEEMPYFMQAAKDYETKGVKVVGVSTDLRRQIESHVKPFLKKRNVPYPVVVFFGDQNEMINSFDSEWTGEIPVTFFYDGSGKLVGKFLRPVTEKELRDKIDELLKK